ncbi:MAG: DUF1015 family protein [Bacteroidota bacterium]
MATIKPFIALRPSAEWFEAIQPKLGSLQSLLENSQGQLSHPKIKKNLRVLKALLKRGNYQSDQVPNMFVYEQETYQGSQFGIWVQSSLADLHNGDVLRHEETITENQEDLRLYRKMVGLEGSPVLLTYPRDGAINYLMERVASRPPAVNYKFDQVQHRLWEISDPSEIENFRQAFAKLPEVFVADGHHRLAAAAATDANKGQWITSLYVSSGQLRCSPFHRLILPATAITKKALLGALNKYYYINEIPGEVAFKPQREGRLGLYHNGSWYQLDLRHRPSSAELQADVSFLQEMILAPFFGITDARTDRRLLSIPESRWDELMETIAKNPDAVVFTLAAINADRLMYLASNNVVLPPKSTYMEPKIPFGLLMHQNKKGVADA